MGWAPIPWVVPTPSLDDDVLEGVRSARPDALGVVYRTYAPALLGWVRSQGVDPPTAEDVVEETFVELVRDCRSITGDGRSLRAWLFTATRRNLLDHHRARHRDRSVGVDRLPEVVSTAPSPDDAVAGRVGHGPLGDALARLSPAQREVIALRYLCDLPTADVAAITGRSGVAVRQLLATARRSMAGRLAGPRDAEHPAAA